MYAEPREVQETTLGGVFWNFSCRIYSSSSLARLGGFCGKEGRKEGRILWSERVF